MATVIVGSGLAGVTVAEGLRKAKPSEAVTILTSETLGVYPRPLLSHGFTRENQREKLIQKTFGALREQGIEVIAGAQARAIEREHSTLRYASSNGEDLTLVYDSLVLAQGSSAMVPAVLRPFSTSFHTLNSVSDLDAITEKRRAIRAAGRIPRIAILGGGLIGCEVASDLAVAGDQVTLIHGGDRLLERVLDSAASARLHEHFSQAGIVIHYQKRIDGISNTSNEVGAKSLCFTQGQAPIGGEQDILLLATGFSPRIELAQAAGLLVRRGIVVNGLFQTTDPKIFAVGDGAEVTDATTQQSSLYPFVAPIRSQALHLVPVLMGMTSTPWTPPAFKAVLKVHGFKA